MGNVLDPAALAELRRLHAAAKGYRQRNGDSLPPEQWALLRALHAALPALLDLAERAAALDAALLERLAQRYAAEPPPGPCKKCGGALAEFCRVEGQVQWRCVNDCIGGVRYTEAGDPEVIRLVRWARGLAAGEGDAP